MAALSEYVDRQAKDRLLQRDAGDHHRRKMAVIAINGWNRLAIAFRPEVGKYQPRAKVE